MMKLQYGVALMLVPVLLRAAPGLAAAPAVPVQERLIAEHQAWTDEQARWNAQHMAAARRLEQVASALRHHETTFDRHGSMLRDHGRKVDREGHTAAARAHHDRLRLEHGEAERRHNRLMDDVADLERTINNDLLPVPPRPAEPSAAN